MTTTQTLTAMDKPRKLSKREQEKEQRRSEAATALHKMGVVPGATIYTIVRSVARSGMSRDISCLIQTPHGIRNISWYVSDILGWRWSDGAVKVSGCGMDMGFHTVYSLSCALFRGDGATPDPGYALKQEWL